MRIRLLRRYDADAFPFGRLKEEYGICALRGARGVPGSRTANLTSVQYKIFENQEKTG